jgi:hypothetical protein
MGTSDTTAEHLEMAAVKKGNRTLAVDDIDWCVSQIDSLCKWHIVNLCPVILICCHRIVESQIGPKVELYLLSSVEILSSTCPVRQRYWQTTIDARRDIE